MELRDVTWTGPTISDTKVLARLAGDYAALLTGHSQRRREAPLTAGPGNPC